MYNKRPITNVTKIVKIDAKMIPSKATVLSISENKRLIKLNPF